MKIAILSIGAHSAKRLVEEAKARGHEPLVLDYRKCYMEIEESRPDVHYAGERVPRVDAVIPRIGARHTDYASAVVRQFEMRGTYTTARSIAIVRSRDKVRTMQLLARDGVPIPKTAVANRPDDIDDLIEQVGGAPLIIKLAQGTHGAGVAIAETKKAAKSVIQAFYSINTPILIQEFIAEAGGADVRLIVVGDKIVAAMKRQGLDEDFRSNIHMGGRGEVVKTTKEERHLARQAAKRLGLDIAGVDIIRSDRGPLIIEVNSSPSFRGIEKTTGINIAAAVIEYVEKTADKKPKKDVIGA